ncbi:hypothetical protein KLP40_00305 [Hymenobacter sp. NST-14]|uniref:hypothetical protein n=1 Tax=Hymenobacter piscis TaxID=2839984 RepID=UPI001C0151A5|nr:hypothetical protein [Hymenobacter piscis]MBT9391585.1 hypothetical protein [Hymenobacter piscis]
MLPPSDRRLQTLAAVLQAPETFPATAWLCAPPALIPWQPESPAAVLLTAVPGQRVPCPPGLVRTLFMDEVQLLISRLLLQVPGATAALRVQVLHRYKYHDEFPALTSQPDELALHLAGAVRAGSLPAHQALAHFRRYFSHFTLEAARHILTQAMLRM